MSNLPSSLAADIASGTSQHALCWRLTRRDGTVIGVTEHDRQIVIGGLTFSPGAALDTAKFVARAGLAPDPATISGAFESEAISEADLDAGLWNGARVDVFRAPWNRQQSLQWSDAFRVWSGRLTGITRRGAAFEAELVSLKADLEAPIGRVIARRCSATLGDGQCGVDLSDPNFEGAMCDKRLGTCVERFNNAENFRGFPDLIGNDALMSGDTAIRDGRSRRRGLP